ncbi:MAG: DUF1801 domain-containing protein [Nanoarchaeales archaeon]|nr:DUF1801 domain-containing protein [Nanoarchaeales archaeon]
MEEEFDKYKEPQTQFEKDLESSSKNLFLDIREVLLSYPQMLELQKSIITTFADDNGPICNMRTMKQTVEITFLKGIKMKDRFKLLTGTGREMRSLIMHKADTEILKYYIDQAVAINSKRRR